MWQKIGKGVNRYVKNKKMRQENEELKQENEELKQKNFELRKIMETTKDLDLYNVLIYTIKNYCNGRIEIPKNYFIRNEKANVKFYEDVVQNKFILVVKE